MTTPSVSRIAWFGLLLAVAGCGDAGHFKPKGGHPLPPSPLRARCQPGQPGGRFVIATTASPKTFNPLFVSDAASDSVTRLLHGSLVTMDLVTHEVGPGLAESWSVEPDQKTWTFKLRQGVRWSDGAPVTAADVVFTWNKIMYDPNSDQGMFELFRIGGKSFEVTNLDNYTVRVVTPEVYAPLVEFFGSVAILPQHILEQAVKQRRFATAYDANTPPERIVGCGPYCLSEFRPGKFTLLVRNPEYWVADSQGRRLPYFDEVMFTVAGGAPGIETPLFLEGKSDVCDTVRPEDFDRCKPAAATGRIQLLDLGLGAERDFLWFNQNPGTNAQGKPYVNPVKLKWFRNKKFRQAISCAINRERIAREVYGGRAQPIYGFLSTENPKWNNLAVPRYSYDPAKARALLAEIGIHERDGVMTDADGNAVEILFNSNTGNPLREKTVTMIQEDLRQLGIKFLSAPMDFRSLLEKINVSFDYECALMGLAGGGTDPASQLNVLRSSEDLHQWFPRQKTPATDWEARIDTLMEAQMRTLDFTRRKQQFDEVQAILAEELPMIYTVAPFAAAAVRADVGNVRPSVLSPYRVTWNLEELYFKK